MFRPEPNDCGKCNKKKLAKKGPKAFEQCEARRINCSKAIDRQLHQHAVTDEKVEQAKDFKDKLMLDFDDSSFLMF